MTWNSDGSVEQTWVNESKQVVSLFLTETAWKILEDQARLTDLSPAEVVERHLRGLPSRVSNSGSAQLQEQLPSGCAEKVYRLTESELEALITARIKAVHKSAFSGPSAGTPTLAAEALVEDAKAASEASTALSETCLEDDWFRQVIDAIPQKVWTCSPTGKIEYYNQQVLQILELTQQQLLSRGWRSIIHREDLPDAIAAWRESLATGNPFEMKLRIQGPERYRWNLVRIHLQRDADGKALRWIGTAINIDNQKHLEQQLQRQAEAQTSHRQWLESVLNLLPTPLMLVDLALQRVTFSNQAANQIAGIDIANDIGDRYDTSYFCTDATGRLIPPDQLPSFRAAQGEKIQGEEINWHTPIGVFPLLVYTDTLPAMHERSTTGIVVFQDISDRKQTENALRKSEERMQIALKAARMFAWEQDCQNDWLIASEGALEVCGFQEGPVEDFIALTHPDDLEFLQQTAQVALTKGTSFTVDYRVLSPDGKLRWISSWGSLYQSLKGQPEKLIGVSIDVTERKQAEEALRESEERFRQLANAVPQIVWVVDAQGNLEYANNHWCEYSGLTLEQGRKREQSLQVIHPDDVEEAYQKWDAALATLQTYQHECRLRRAVDGSYRWFLVRAVPAKDEFGRLLRWYGTSTDIHDRKQVEQEREHLLERERIAREEAETARRQLSTLFETAPIGMALLDAQQRYRSINEALAEINGLSREAILGHTPAEVFSHSDSNIINLCNEIYRTGQPFIAPNLSVYVPGRRDRRPGYYSVYYLPTTNNQGQVESLLAYVIDVTERFRLEQVQRFLANASQVLSSSLDYETTLASIARLAVPHLADWCTVHIVDETGATQRLAVAHVNPDKVAWADELEQRYPYDPDEPRGVPQVIRTGQPELYTEIPDHLLVEAARDEEHLRILREVGFTSAMIVPLQAQGRPIGAISFIGAESGRCYDQTDLELAEELGRRAALAVENARLYALAKRDRDRAEAANRVKDEFLAVLSHELRSPLNPILGWVALLRQGRLSVAKTTYAIETIERNAKLQIKLIEDLLDVSRILRGKLSLNTTPVELPAIIEAALETVHLAAEAKAIHIRTHLNPACAVLGDAARLQQVIWNLLSNAVKFTPEGGTVTVCLERVEAEEVPDREESAEPRPQEAGENISLQRPISSPLCLPAYAQITVTDTGQGIHPDFLPHVFEYFRQADSTTTRTFGGLGLGLAIVRHLVELHGGSVQADSLGEGLGATFRVRLPALPQQETQAEADMAAADSTSYLPTLKGRRILLVDDDPDTRDVITFTLEEAGAAVTPVTSAEEALTVFQQASFDLLLSDIGMPNTDGYSLIRKIRALPPQQGGQIAAIALTAYAGEFNQQQALAAGFQLHLAKPVDPEYLIDKVASLPIESR